MAQILVVDDEPSIAWGLAKLGEGLGHRVTQAASAEQGLELAAGGGYELLVLDVRLPGVDGLTAMPRFRELLGGAPIIVITAFGDLRTAVDAVGNGAFEYLTKPFTLAEARGALERALRPRVAAPPLGATPPAEGELLGASPAMQGVFKRIALAAHSTAPVLITGESGVGKELAARAIHRHGPRGDGSFVAVNAAALSPGLAEAELFGHVEGAFTGAGRARRGLLAEADGGTLFLDEVADIPPPLQVKLLRALDLGEVLPVGADKPLRTRFRVLSATHQSLPGLVASGAFRHDLYYRLAAFEIALPPLRERPEDISLLATGFVARTGGGATLAPATLDELRRRPWRGNVRELRSAVEHALVVARGGVILPEHLPPAESGLGAPAEPEAARGELASATRAFAERLLADPEASGAVYERFLREVEAPLLLGAMRRFGDECAPAARALGLHRTTLRKKLDLLHAADGVGPPAPSPEP